MGEYYTSHMPPEIRVWSWSGFHFTLRTAIEYSSARSVDNPVAQARFMLKGKYFGDDVPALKGQKYEDVFGLYDFVQVRIRDRGGAQWVELLGLVQRIQENAPNNDGFPSTDTAIEIRSIGELLMRYQPFWHPTLPIASLNALGFLVRSKGKPVSGRPEQVLKSFFDLFINNTYQMKTADGRDIRSVFNLAFDKPKDGAITMNLSGIGHETSLWDVMDGYADKPWNLLFVDVPHETRFAAGLEFDDTMAYGDQERVYFRPAPFDADAWSNLSQEAGWSFEYDGSDKIDGGEDLYIDAEGSIVNYLWVGGKPLFGSFDQLVALNKISGGKVPLLDTESIRRFGLRRLELKTEYVQFADTSAIQGKPLTPADRFKHNTTKNTHWQMLKRRAEQAWRWFGYPKFKQGSITTAGRVGADKSLGARIGGVLRNKADGREYWISSLAQDWRMESPWTTTMGLERGHKPADVAKWWASRNPADVKPD